MVSWLPTAVIPGLVALAFLPIERRRILWMLPVVWLPDIDYLLGLVGVGGDHRAFSHAVWIPAALVAALAWSWRWRDPTARFWEYATRPGHPGHLLLAAYYWGAHIILDVFTGGVVLFWPLLNVNFYYVFALYVNTRTNELQPFSEGGTHQGAPEVAPLYEWVSVEHFAILMFLAASAAWGVVAWWRSRRRRPARVWREARLVA